MTTAENGKLKVQNDTSETGLAITFGISSLLSIFNNATHRLGASKPTFLQEPDLSDENILKVVAGSSLTHEQARSWIQNS
jgi:hypothetical protein